MSSRTEHSSAESAADAALLRRVPWLTNRTVVLFLIGWMLLFGAVSADISNPFQTEPSAGANPNYWHVMYLHGLLIGMVALGALVACNVFALSSRHVRIWIALGALAATIPAARRASVTPRDGQRELRGYVVFPSARRWRASPDAAR